MESRFAAPMCRDVKAMTRFFPLIFGGNALVPFLMRFPLPTWTLVLSATFQIGIVAYLASYKILAYIVTDDSLIIRYLGRPVTIPLASLASATVDPEVLPLPIRRGIAFSIMGVRQSSKWGTYRAYASDPSRAVVLSFADRRIVVTPDRPEEFAELLTRRIQAGAYGAAAGPVSEHAPANRDTTRRSEEEPC